MLLTGDRELMEYAFYNLLTNAIKYSPPRTQVTLAAAAQARPRLYLGGGPGHRHGPERGEEDFQKFYRTRRAEQSGEAGTGIGLSIVEQIVIQHGGTIEVMSRPGKGPGSPWFCRRRFPPGG